MPRHWASPLLGLGWVGPLLPGAASLQAREPEANLPYLFAVYAVTWAVFFAYVFFMSRKQQELRRELDALRRLLEQKEQTTTEHPRAEDESERRPSS